MLVLRRAVLEAQDAAKADRTGPQARTARVAAVCLGASAGALLDLSDKPSRARVEKPEFMPDLMSGLGTLEGAALSGLAAAEALVDAAAAAA